MTSIYPKLPGLPTTPGLYEMRRGLRVEFGRVIARDLVDMPCIQVQWTGGYCTLASVAVCEGWTFYGPIPEPLTTDREPCAAWVQDEARNRWTLGEIAAVDALSAGMYSWSTDHDDGMAFDPRVAQLAAEDAVLAEAWQRIETIGGRPRREPCDLSSWTIKALDLMEVYIRAERRRRKEAEAKAEDRCPDCAEGYTGNESEHIPCKRCRATGRYVEKESDHAR